ncbi:unnamed protein product [Cylindrotheca closterium]|uniref:RxLR effector candidate protein n=1 Tax=Cylindrotheca closterium TaxID=2856 RepID=A0AAD2FT26_9STRA|nr:unnamed protein product [Cylindrotheca closterium]
MRVSTVLSLTLLTATSATTNAFSSNSNGRAIRPLHLSDYAMESSVDYSLQQQQQQQQQRREDRITLLPPRREMSKLEIEFRDMLEAMIFTDSDMTAITDSRLRALYEGVAASYHEPSVYRAFEVLYEDFAPLRVAGRVVHQKLTSIMKESLEYKIAQLEAVQKFKSFSFDEIESLWSVFTQLTNGRELSVEDAKRCLGTELDELIDSKGLTFEGLLFLYKDLPYEAIVDKLQAALPAESTTTIDELDDKRRRYSQRYDEMLVQFAVWKDFIPDGEGRRLDILRGCFVGSENPKVVEALKIIYVDYAALRMSGNWIFKLVSALMSRATRQQQQQPQQRQGRWFR